MQIVVENILDSTLDHKEYGTPTEVGTPYLDEDEIVISNFKSECCVKPNRMREIISDIDSDRFYIYSEVSTNDTVNVETLKRLCTV